MQVLVEQTSLSSSVVRCFSVVVAFVVVAQPWVETSVGGAWAPCSSSAELAIDVDSFDDLVFVFGCVFAVRLRDER